jgi:hypothetical protein
MWDINPTQAVEIEIDRVIRHALEIAATPPKTEQKSHCRDERSSV